MQAGLEEPARLRRSVPRVDQLAMIQKWAPCTCGDTPSCQNALKHVFQDLSDVRFGSAAIFNRSLSFERCVICLRGKSTFLSPTWYLWLVSVLIDPSMPIANARSFSGEDPCGGQELVGCAKTCTALESEVLCSIDWNDTVLALMED